MARGKCHQSGFRNGWPSTFPARRRLALDPRLCTSDEPRAVKPPELERYHVSNQGLLAVPLSGVKGLSGVGAQSVSRFTAAGHGDTLETLLKVLEQEAEHRRQRRIGRLRTASRRPLGKVWCEDQPSRQLLPSMTMRTDNKSESHREVIILLYKPVVQRGLTDLQSLTMLTPSRLSRHMSLKTTNMGNHGW